MKPTEPEVQFPRLVATNQPAVRENEAEETDPRDVGGLGRFFDSSNRIVMGAVVIIIGAFLVTLVFAAFAPVNRGAVAPGQITALGVRHVIQHLDGGVVEKLLVREGDHVKANQLLVKLDERSAAIQLRLLEEQRRLMMIESAILSAEQTGQTRVAWPAEVLAHAGDPSTAQAMITGQSLLFSRVSARNASKAVLQEQNVRLQSHAQGLEAQKRGLIEQQRLIKIETDSLQELYDKGLTTRTRILALQRNAADLQGSIGSTEAAVNQDRVQMGENRLRSLSLDSDMQQTNAKRLQELQGQIFELDDRIANQALVVQRTSIRSPVDGVVLNRAVNSTGAVIRPGEPILEITPNTRLMVRANVKVQDIDKVHVGQKAVVRMSGLNVQTTPRLSGKVIYVSSDALTNSEGTVHYYEARIEIPESEIRKIRNTTITPGMSAEVMIDAGSRTVLSYLLQPVTLAFSHAFREG